MEVYGEPVECSECGSDNVVERYREVTTNGGRHTSLPVAVCLTCGEERSL